MAKKKKHIPVRLGQGGPVIGRVISTETKPGEGVYATMEIGRRVVKGRVL